MGPLNYDVHLLNKAVDSLTNSDVSQHLRAGLSLDSILTKFARAAATSD